MKQKLAVIIVYFGEFPKYMHYFLKSASYSKQADFLIFTDADYSTFAKYNNINFLKFSLSSFNRLVNERIDLGVNIQIKNSYKLCDLKPMYGFIFQQYIADYAAWAHSDIDLLLGNFTADFQQVIAGEIDIASSHDRYISGAFTAYRNVEYVNTLFMTSKDYRRVLCDDKVLYFDEASNVIAKLWEGHDIFDFNSEIESMTHIVKNEKNKIRSSFLGIIVERLEKEILFDNGLIRERDNNIKIFHFLLYKGNILFNVPNYNGVSEWVFNRYGIFAGNRYANSISFSSSVIKNFSSKLKIKLRSFYKKVF